MATIYTDNFITKLGIINCCIQSNIEDSTKLEESIIEKGKKITILSKGHMVELYSFTPPTDWLSGAEMSVESAHAWVWRITKRNTTKEQLKINCFLHNSGKGTVWGKSDGENLDAILITDEKEEIVIGTEDADLLKTRARINDQWMPNRFAEVLNLYNPAPFSFTNATEFGYETIIPELFENEKIYFHFIAATNPVKRSKKYPDENDVSTWYEVHLTKENLLAWLNITG